jgi:hypothetical protein
MRELLEGYPGNALNGTQLRDSLGAQMEMIFERCTMKGEAHEALHQYLQPLQGMIGRIPDAPGAVQLDSLERHFGLYDEVFY